MKVRRGRIDDEIVLDGERVVLVGQQVILLSPLAGFALGQLRQEDWTRVPELAAGLVQEFGDPGDPEAVTAEILRELAEARVVEVAGAEF